MNSYVVKVIFVLILFVFTTREKHKYMNIDITLDQDRGWLNQKNIIIIKRLLIFLLHKSKIMFLQFFTLFFSTFCLSSTVYCSIRLNAGSKRENGEE